MSRPNWIGKTLVGRYRIDEILGQGGMSAVYKAYDPNLKRVVAIKMIHSHLADDPKFLARFEEEAAAVAQLRHPNIVQVFDFNHDEDVYFMVQEFVPGETLQERLRRYNRQGRRMTLSEAVGITQNICAATGYAHQRGMVHRDIKPANIMLDVNGNAILMDFGIVKIVGSDRHTATGAVVGTALYLPPEMVRGMPPDARSDMYSLGVTLFEMLNGRPPFEADSAMTLMMMHLNDPVPDLRQLRPEVPAAMVAVIERTLAKDREQRYPSMETMSAALQAALDQPAAAGSQATVIDKGGGAAAIAAASQTPAPHEQPPVGTPQPADSQAGMSQPVASQPRPMAAAAAAAGVEATLASPQPGGSQTPPPQPFTTTPQAGVSQTPPPQPYTTTPPVGVSQTPPPQPVGSGGGAGSPPVAVTGASQPSGKKVPLLVWIGGGAALLVIVLIGLYLMLGRSGGGNSGAAGQPSSTAPAAAAVLATDTPSPSATLTPTVTNTPLPTDTPTPTLSPTPTIPVGVPYVNIKGITLNDTGQYVVDYETFEYTEVLPGQHVHFFFNTVPPEAAGNPGKGPWILYGGPRPFAKYKQSERPEAASMMCALVANPDHSIQLNSGTCAILPDIVAAAPVMDMPCRGGPSEEYPEVMPIPAGKNLLVSGMSEDEDWWNVLTPEDPVLNCWLPRELTMVSGDWTQLPLAEAPFLPSGPTIEITGITVNSQGKYEVAFTPNNFTPEIPGTHIHFYFNSVPLEQVAGLGGGKKMYGGLSPFSGYAPGDRPADANQMCAVVANRDHSIIDTTVNCFPLP